MRQILKSVTVLAAAALAVSCGNRGGTPLRSSAVFCILTWILQKDSFSFYMGAVFSGA